VGARPIDPGTTIDALVRVDGARDHLIMRELRIPCTLGAVAAGAALAVAGALMRGLRRDPLASRENRRGPALAAVLSGPA
jgi:iron complex transport system permease protein